MNDKDMDYFKIGFLEGYVYGLRLANKEELIEEWKQITDEIWNGRPDAQGAFPGLAFDAIMRTECIFDEGE